MSVIRGTGLANYAALVSELGGNANDLLYGAGVHPSDAGDHDALISYRGLVLAVERAAAATDTPDFGRLLARRQGIEILGPVGVAARTAPTMGDALQICSAYLSAYSPSVEVRLIPEEDPARTLLELRIVGADLPPHPQVYELSVGIALGVLRNFRGQDFRPLAVRMPHHALTDPDDYRAFFSCPPEFDQRTAGLVIRTSDLAAPLSTDALAHQAVVRYLDGIVTSGAEGFAGPVADLVRRLLPTGAVSRELVAAQFALHPKTLQRRLGGEGTTFGAVVEQTRRDLAEHLLRDTDLGLTQIARELGYAEQSVLTRSCHRWFGRGPSAQRSRLRGRPVS